MATPGSAAYLQRNNGGRGVLLGGVPGVAPGRVAVLGGGVVGLTQPRWPSAWARMSPCSI
ncbi:MAG: hypothetical protein R2873_28330 [Caldilineaceae bacterium]